VAGLSIIGRSWLLEMRLELHDGFDPSAVESAARDRGATLISAVPAMLDRFDTSVFRVVLVGGSAMPARLPGNAVASYGMTEAAGAVCLDGRPIDGAEVRVTDGEVWIRGPMVGRAERFGDDPAGRRLVDEDGWLHTGDEGALDETGTLAVAGRRGDVIVTGGEKVWPGPVEQRLAEHAAIEAVAVVGRPDDRWGNAVTAVVVPADAARPPSLAELRSWVKETLPAYAAPQTLELTDDLPRTALGKIRRRPV
jgi:O-succinylbenzoic acid--CoA ligase